MSVTGLSRYNNIMQAPTSIVVLNFFVILLICINSAECEKEKADKDELKDQKLPPCAACKVFANSFIKVNTVACDVSIIKIQATELNTLCRHCRIHYINQCDDFTSHNYFAGFRKDESWKV